MESLRALSRTDRLLNPYDPKQLKMISTLWRARGLLGKWKTDEKFFKHVQNVMNSPAARKGGYASLGKAIEHIFGGKGKYTGLPLDYDKTGSSSKGDRNVTKVYWNKRKVQQTIPLHIRDRVARLEKDGTFERAGIKPGILDRIETRRKKGETRLKKEVLRLQKLYGIKFEMGHLTAIANLGTDNPLNLFPEMKSENRSHGAREDPLEPQVQKELGWGGGHEEDLYEMILEEGGNPAVLGVSGDKWTSGDQGKLARMDADPNQVGFARRDAILNSTLKGLESKLQRASEEGNLLQFVDDINARITDKGYQSIAPTLKPQPKGEILEVVPNSLRINQNHPKYNQLESPKRGLSIVDRLLTPRQQIEPPGTGFNRNINALSNISQGIARDAIERTPAGFGASLGQQIGSGDYVGAASSVLGARVDTIEKLDPKSLQYQRILPASINN
jgi:hypothetical protein